MIVYGLSIPLWIIETMIDVKGLPLDFQITDILSAFTPLIAACILVYKEEGKNGVKNLIKRILDFSKITKGIWFVPIILLPILIYTLIYLVIYFSGLSVPNNLDISFKAIPFLFILFFIGAVCEETGYMGYAVDTMQARFGALSASILIGTPWAIWHYPSIINQGHNFTWILWGTIGTVAVRVLIVWIYNNTQKSLFAAILFHTMFNLGKPFFPKDEIHNPLVDYPYVHYSVIAVVAVIVIYLWGSKTLARYRYISLKFNNFNGGNKIK